MKRARWRRLFVAGAAVLMTAALPVASRAATHVDASITFEAAHSPRLDIDVWTNKEEGGVYRQGEGMRVFFRPSADAYVLIYNIDTEGSIHLVYPYDRDDPDFVEGGRTYQVPSRNDPYDLVADGPTGIEYVVAIASPFPFRDLPWYLTGGAAARDQDEYGDDEDEEDSGVIVGDPYVGMDRIVRRVVGHGREDDVATADTYFYIERKVDYPRYVCADCHSYGGWFDPYGDVCSVVDIRIDAGWAHYRPLRWNVLRPRFYYNIRTTAPTRYRQWKDRWSTIDGRATLRTRFQVDGTDKFQSRRQIIQRRTPPEFQRLRTPREGRVWRPDEVLRRNGNEGDVIRDRRDVRDYRDRTAPRNDTPDVRSRDQANDRDARRREYMEQRQRREQEMQQYEQRRGEQRQRQMQEDRRDQQRQSQERRRDDQAREQERARGEESRRRDESRQRDDRQQRDEGRQRDDHGNRDRGDRGDGDRGDRGRGQEQRHDDRGSDHREGGWGRHR